MHTSEVAKEFTKRSIMQGDVLENLAKLPNDCIDTVITSPPYYGLRDYGVDGQIGLEPTIQEYLSKLHQIMEALRRVLKPTGSVFWNIGDTYAGGKAHADWSGTDKQFMSDKQRNKLQFSADKDKTVKPKSLYGIPQRFMIDCIDAGWICRNAIIWHKFNAMPFSGSDRLTNKYEPIFHFTKNKKYYYNLKPIREPSLETKPPKHKDTSGQTQLIKGASAPKPYHKNMNIPRPKSGPHSMHTKRVENRKWTKIGGQATQRISKNHYGCYDQEGKPINHIDGKNPGDIWTINPIPNPSIHSSTFPPDLPRKIISCACPPNGIVLDPFAGSGTTLEVAAQMGRKWIGIEINPSYVEIIKKRMGKYGQVLCPESKQRG